MRALRVSTGGILAHSAEARATACPECGGTTGTLADDTGRLLEEITRLYESLRTARMRAANLEAAIRAAIHAQEDSDHDPIGYLRDEIGPNPGGVYGP